MNKICIVTLLGLSIVAKEPESSALFRVVFPLRNFKTVVDTCMRAYTDTLMLHEKIMTHEKYDELLDTLVGRLVRLESYVHQLVHGYTYEATVSFDELEYLLQIMHYLEITIAENDQHDIALALNSIIASMKNELLQALGMQQPLVPIIARLLPQHWSLPRECQLYQYS